jgi:transposase
MGTKRAPAVRLCVTCGQLKSAGQFEPGRYKCIACQSEGRRRWRPARAQHDPHASLHARARDQALRRLGREHLAAYREHYQAQRRVIPSTVPADLARKRAVNRALRALERRHRPRYGELYQQELRRARSRRHLRRPGRPAGTRDRLTIRAEPASTWEPDAAGSGQSRQGEEWARQRANLEAVRERATELFAEGRSAATVAKDLHVARQTATAWRARWQSGGAAALRNQRIGRPPAVPDSQLPAIEQALLTGAAAHGFDSDRWTMARVAVVVQRITGVQLGRRAVQLLLRERLGWRFQPAPSGVTAHPLLAPTSATDSLAAVAAATLVNLGKVSAGLPALARPSRPATPAERREAIAQAWRDEPGISSTILAERFGVSRRNIQHDTQVLQGGASSAAWPPAGQKPPHPGPPRQHLPAVHRLAGRRAWPAPYRGGSQRRCSPPLDRSAGKYERLLGEPERTTPVGVRDRAILRLLGDVGLHSSEVCALKLEDLIWGADGRTPVQLRVAWGEGRVVQLSPEATAALAGWLPHHPDWPPDGRDRELPAAAPLFVALGSSRPIGQALTEADLLRQVLRHAQQAGIPRHLRYPYVLRHFWASQQVARGITPAELQARGGWRDPAAPRRTSNSLPLRPF